MPARFQIQQARNGKYYFHLLANNGEIILASQMYASRSSAKKGILSVQTNAADPSRYEQLVNKAGQHYFVLKAKNSQVIGTSEGYAATTGMKNANKSVSQNAPKAITENIIVKT